MIRTKQGSRSGLTFATLRRYAKSDNMEYGDNLERPFYLHRANCPSFCDFACNGNRGFHIAEDAADFFGSRYSPKRPT